MKSKMLATIMMTPAVRNWFTPSAQAATTLISTPINVSVLGWMPSRTHALMIARRGHMHTFPMNPVNVMLCYN